MRAHCWSPLPRSWTWLLAAQLKARAPWPLTKVANGDTTNWRHCSGALWLLGGGGVHPSQFDAGTDTSFPGLLEERGFSQLLLLRTLNPNNCPYAKQYSAYLTGLAVAFYYGAGRVPESVPDPVVGTNFQSKDPLSRSVIRRNP